MSALTFMVAFVSVFNVSNKLSGCYAGRMASHTHTFTNSHMQTFTYLHIHTFTQSKQGMQARTISVAFGLEQAKQARHSLKLSFPMPPKKIQPAVAEVAEATDEKEKADIDDSLLPPSEQKTTSVRAYERRHSAACEKRKQTEAAEGAAVSKKQRVPKVEVAQTGDKAQRQAAPMKAVPKKAIPKKTIPKKAFPKKTIPEKLQPCQPQRKRFQRN